MRFPAGGGQGAVYKVAKKYHMDPFIGVNDMILDEDNNFREVIFKRGHDEEWF